MSWIEKLTGSLEQKKQYKQAVARIDALPEPYRTLTRAKLVRDARGDGVEDGLRRVAGWGLRYDLVPVDADRDVSQRSQGADDLADARPAWIVSPSGDFAG